MKADMTILYVTDPEFSAGLYATLFGRAPVELSPGFGLFVLEGGVKLGLWKQAAVLPKTNIAGGGAELVLHVGTDAELEAAHATLSEIAGLSVLEAPVRREFGYTFTATDPDQHRIRVLKTEG